MIGEMVLACETFATVGAFKRLFIRMYTSIVTLKTSWAAESTRADVADQTIGRTLSQQLLAVIVARLNMVNDLSD